MNTLTTPPSRSGTRPVRTGSDLLLAGAAGAVLTVATFTIGGALRPGYDPVRHYVSQLSLGPGGWVQVANFLVTGALMLVLAVGLRRRLAPNAGGLFGPILLATFGLGPVGAGLFPADPGLNGFPPGTSIPPDSPTFDFRVHIVSAIVVFCSLPAAALVLARRFRRDGRPGWATYSVATGVLVRLLWAGSTILIVDGSAPIDAIGGLVQRGYLVLGFGWVAAVALRLRK
jgi:hypothetical membrane protein